MTGDGSRCDSCSAADDMYWSKRHDAWFCDGCYVRENADVTATQVPVLPPVVPDSEPTDLDALRMDLSDEERWTRGWVLGPKIHEVRCIECGKTGTHRVCAACFVPAVTDDEAAAKKAVALALAAVDGYDNYARQANGFIAHLRAAGFSLVRSTREDT